MDTKAVWDLLSTIPASTIVAWIILIAAIVSAVWFVIIKLFKVFDKYRNLREQDEEQTKLLAAHDELLSGIRDELVKISGSIHNDILEQHDDLLNEIRGELVKINDSMEEQKGVTLAQLRHSIVRACREALVDGYISAAKLESLEGLFTQYVDVFNGNGYVHTLMEKVRELPVVGSLED